MWYSLPHHQHTTLTVLLQFWGIINILIATSFPTLIGMICQLRTVYLQSRMNKKRCSSSIFIFFFNLISCMSVIKELWQKLHCYSRIIRRNNLNSRSKWHNMSHILLTPFFLFHIYECSDSKLRGRSCTSFLFLILNQYY